ncbi:uncharacterized protein DNG_06266 [Cephalotrichum gorgonifer]|uniref:Celp0028 effector like protein n=1 Tax=Cephalotrichum gorgonifer TaxID=2041049 RepID=A0AAE8SWD7_9PEZI|nr:uncharacterized protein DNG_06266 [Cephalotrichum gorgonifer]
MLFFTSARTTVLISLLSLVSASPTAQSLSYDDVVLLGEDGKTTIMKDYEYAKISARETTAEHAIHAMSGRRTPRGCEESSEVQVLTDETILSADIPLSPVIGSQGGQAVVAVSQGYSISNTVSVGASAGASFLEGVLSLSLSVSYDESWSSSQEQSLTFTVPDGQYGLIVSQPSTRRVSGNLLTGCTDSWNKEEFVSETYSSRSYGNLNWVQGVIRLCNSTEYPVPYCVGQGFHS